MLRELRRNIRELQKERRDQPDAPQPSLFAEDPDLTRIAAGPAPEITQNDARHQTSQPLTPGAQGVALERARLAAPRLAESLERLNLHQLSAVVDDRPAALVRAQVGSGKTTVLVHKILWLHLVEGVPMAEIAVLTFTHKAAGEIRTRLEGLATATGQPLAPQDFWLTGTFHAVARTLLRTSLPIAELGWTSEFTVLDEASRLALWQRVIAEQGLTVRYANRLAQRMAQLRRGQTRMGAMKAEDDIARLAALAVVEKKRLNVLDFDDLLDTATWLLQEHPLTTPLRWLLVDEFQDCHPGELAFVRALRGPESAVAAKFFAVGDPNQVIYGWRGSSPGLFDAAQSDFAAVRLDLPLNYRSTPQILDSARSVLGWQGTQSTLGGARPDGTRITVRRHHNPHLESLYLVQRLRQLQATGVRLREIGVLFRMRRQAVAMHAWLSAAGVPCQEPGRAAVQDRPAVLWVLDMLRLGLQAVDPEDVRTRLTHPSYGLLTPKQWNKRSFAKFTSEHGDITDGVALSLAFLQRKSATRDHDFAAVQLQRWQGLPAWLDSAGEVTGEELFTQLDLEAALRPTSAHHQADVADARQLVDRLTGWMQAHGVHGAQGLRAALDLLALGGLTVLGETTDPALDAVALLTLHAAKGLEFRHVFISGANQGLIPLQSAWGSAEVDAEERRLLFVGMTRARDGLEISYHNQPAHPQAQPVPSPYLYQVPAHAVEWLDREPASVPPIPAPVETEPLPTSVEDPRLPFAVGERVRHPRYGVGTVSASTAEHVDVNFDKLGERSFDRQLCPLTSA